MEIASLTAIVVNSIGNPPASDTPSLHLFASASNGKLHGVTSFHDEATPICAFEKSSSPIPTARNIARAGALLAPSVTSRDLGFISISLFSLIHEG